MDRKTRNIIMALFVLVIALPLSAAWTWGDLSFSIAPGDPLFKESRSNPFSNTTTFSYLSGPNDTDYLPSTFLVADPTMNGGNGGYRELPFYDPDPGHNSFWHLRAAMNTGIMRFGWADHIKAEIYLHGGLNSVFCAWGGVNVLGFDGMYGVGGSLELFDVAVLRFGAHHFSGHWGDEVMKKFEEKNPDFSGTLLEYTRNNSYFLDISIEPVKYFRILAEAELPLGKAWIRPSAHVPQNTVTPGYGDNQFEHTAPNEGVKRPDPYPDSYRGWRIGLGAEAELPVRGAGNIFVSYDFQMHQDGKIDLEKLVYDENRPWDTEHTVTAGFEFEDSRDDPSFTIAFTYHDGRFPLLNYFFQKSRYMEVGLTASF